MMHAVPHCPNGTAAIEEVHDLNNTPFIYRHAIYGVTMVQPVSIRDRTQSPDPCVVATLPGSTAIVPSLKAG